MQCHINHQFVKLFVYGTTAIITLMLLTCSINAVYDFFYGLMTGVVLLAVVYDLSHVDTVSIENMLLMSTTCIGQSAHIVVAIRLPICGQQLLLLFITL